MIKSIFSKFILTTLVAGGVIAGSAGLAGASVPPSAVPPAPAPAASVLHGPLGHRVPDAQPRICGAGQWKWVDHFRYVLYNDVFGPSDQQCLYNHVDGSNFRITSSTTPEYAWNAYPALFSGCEYGVCSKGTPLPEHLSSIKSATATIYSRFAASQLGNDATDFWFSTFNPRKQTSRHPNGAELMIWLKWRAVPRHGGYVVRFGNYRWYFEHWRTCQDGTCWNYEQFRWLGHHNEPSVTRLDLMPFLNYSRQLGLMRRSWWADAFATGYEVVQHGAGSHVSLYSLNIS
jgi:Glycosyl hydrolase family 12